ncbi:RrF2 family transcriptional regulator [Flavisolibacter ginsenosidimutans]|uniref:Rrf2 family transcriptional regulator n=1 Tax=Flavisolibacter ginsenosidimutans TaxID=661481 RepID=A0A5B8UGE3_9BACT|nr:Rrf2 family transcriptional regulator [Flavisolibacter ginsenosidimutans]QEC55435.1 Rrf2 family transcriptional regulator [Flavisolibacter ginsenosidimutans]
MLFSKSFGYAVRGVLYITLMQDSKQFVQAEEIAVQLSAPRYFMSKILKNLVKAGVLASSKGKTGGFTVNEKTRSLSLSFLAEITDGTDMFNKCVLRLQDCDVNNPCPVHEQMHGLRQRLQALLSSASINDLLHGDKEHFIKSIATAYKPTDFNDRYANRKSHRATNRITNGKR